MKKLFYLGFCLVLMAGFGCAITDYGVITDNNQVQNSGGVQPTINTKGKAHIQETSQIATLWPDGSDETINFVDQKADGTGTLTTYNNFSSGGDPTFHDDLYCNTAWTGCSMFTAPDDNSGLANAFDGTFNTNCQGARSLSILLSTGRYYGECGSQAAKLGVLEKMALLDTAVVSEQFGRNGLLWRLDSSNTSISIKNVNTGISTNIPFYGVSVDHFLSNSGNVAFTFADHPMLGAALRGLAQKLESELNGDAMIVTVQHNGVELSFTMAGGAHWLDPASAVRGLAAVY